MSIRYNVEVIIKRGDQPAYGYNYNRQPLRPGKVDRVMDEAIKETASNITRGFRYPVDIRDYDGLSCGFSGDIVFVVRKVAA